MAIGLIWINRGLSPWRVGVALFGLAIVLISAFLGIASAHLYRSHGPRSVRAALYGASSLAGGVMGGLSLWLAAFDLGAGHLAGFAVGVSHVMGNLGIIFFVLSAIALFSDSRSY